MPYSSLVYGVIGAEDAELLSDAVVDEGVFEVHAVAPDQRHQLVELDLGYDLKESEWQILKNDLLKVYKVET